MIIKLLLDNKLRQEALQFSGHQCNDSYTGEESRGNMAIFMTYQQLFPHERAGVLTLFLLKFLLSVCFRGGFIPFISLLTISSVYSLF